MTQCWRLWLIAPVSWIWTIRVTGIIMATPPVLFFFDACESNWVPRTFKPPPCGRDRSHSWKVPALWAIHRRILRSLLRTTFRRGRSPDACVTMPLKMAAP